nr:unnamed protein product [Digitaria exilis]
MEAEAAVPRLPDDALAAILRRLPQRAIAESRRVCKAWRAVVDGRGLLRPHLLPRAVRGIFVNFIDYRCPRFLARPSSSERPGIQGNLDFLPGYTTSFAPIIDHRNGLLLYGHGREFYVVNPATRRWERLPPRMELRDYAAAYLVFDPAASPHYEVVLIPRVPEDPRETPPPFDLDWVLSSLGDNEEEEEAPRSVQEGFFPARFMPVSGDPDPYRSMEWPFSPCTPHVFSSSTRQWEERPFVREGKGAGTVEDARLDSERPRFSGPRWRYGVYWRGTLYAHCHGAFVMRLSLGNGTYQVIKTPIDIEEGKRARTFLGKSENGVYFAAIDDNDLLRVWILNEHCGHADWVMKHHSNLGRSAMWGAERFYNNQQIDGPWILEDDKNDEDDSNMMLQEESCEWDSDNDNVLDDEGGDEDRLRDYTYFLGFHPYKEVVFLMLSFIGIAYHLNTSKVQFLGKMRPKHYHSFAAGVYESFPYTPCMVGELGEANLENQQCV